MLLLLFFKYVFVPSVPGNVAVEARTSGVASVVETPGAAVSVTAKFEVTNGISNI